MRKGKPSALACQLLMSQLSDQMMYLASAHYGLFFVTSKPNSPTTQGGIALMNWGGLSVLIGLIAIAIAAAQALLR